MHTKLLIFTTLLTGCGESLLSGEALESMMGLTPLPGVPAWEVRWYAGAEEPIQLNCSLQTTEITTDDLYWERLYSTLPTLEEPAFWIPAEDYRYAIGLFTLVDAERYVYSDEVAWDDEADFESLDFWRGVWGGVAGRALLFAEGDLERMAEEALLVPEALEVAEDGPIWVGMLPELVEVKEDLIGTLYPLPDEEYEELETYGLEVTPVDFLASAAEDILSGQFNEAGVTGCPE